MEHEGMEIIGYWFGYTNLGFPAIVSVRRDERGNEWSYYETPPYAYRSKLDDPRDESGWRRLNEGDVCVWPVGGVEYAVEAGCLIRKSSDLRDAVAPDA